MCRKWNLGRIGTFLAVVVLLVAAGASSAADFPGWAKRASITFSGYTKGEALTNFPALVVLGTNISGFSYADFASSSGGDLRFADANGNELNYEVDSWNAGGASYVWVQVPTLASSNDFIYAYWGNAGQATPPVYTTNGLAWSAYRGVWHLGEPAANGLTTAVHYDSTANRLDGQQNQNNDAAGVIGKGQYLDGANDWIDVTNKPVLSMGQNFAFSGWLRFDGTTVSWNRPVSRKTAYNAGDGWELQLHNGNDSQLDAGGSSGTQPSANPMVPSWTSHAWYYVTVVYNGSTAYFYRDGVLRGSGGLTAVVDNNANKLVFGNNAAHNEVKWNGMIDEFRIQAGVPSSNWIWATYQNMPGNNAQFQAWGEVQNQNSAAPSISTRPAAHGGGTSADVIGNYVTNGVSAATVYVFWGPTDGGTNWGAWANTNNLGSPAFGLLTDTVSSLTYGATYVYRYCAVNATADCWGLPVSFTTLGPPAFSGVSAAVTPVSASLSASLSSTGAAPTTVSCWFGTSPSGLSQVDSWPATAQPQMFVHTQSGLTPGLTYYYAFKAANTTPDSHLWEVWTATNAFTTPTSYVWVGGGIDNNWSTGPNWDSGVAPANNGTANITFSGSNRPTPMADAPWNVQSMVFANLGTAFQLSGSGLTLQTGGLSNQNTTAGRPVTISNTIAVAGAQTWRTAGNNNSITVLNGNLTGGVGSDMTVYGNGCNNGAAPELQLGGTNAGFAGNVVLNPVTGGASDGILLRRPTAMVGGNVNLGGYNQCLYIDGTAGTYTFGIGTGAGQVRFRAGGNNGGGLWLTGGAAVWDPGNGGTYAWGNSLNEINLGGRDASCPNAMLYIGNSGSDLIFSNGDKTISSSSGNSPANGQVTTLLSALSDDGVARALTTSAKLLILTRPADNRGLAANLGGATVVSGGALAVSAMNQIFNGNLNLSGGVFVFNGLSGADFSANRVSGYGAGTKGWQITGASGGFAARGTKVVIAGGSAGDFDRNFSLGTPAFDTDGSYYANAPVEIAQNTTLGGRRFVRISAHQGPGFWPATFSSVAHRLSGNLSGTGVVYVAGNRYAAAGAISELVLAGTNIWSGNPFISNVDGIGFNAGQGGLAIAGSAANDANGDCLVRFDGIDSLPRGAPESAYLVACKPYDSNFMTGYLLTGGDSERAYSLPSYYKFVLGRFAGYGAISTLGSAGGLAALRGSTVAVNVFGGAATNTGGMGFVVRDGQLRLGTAGSPLILTPTYSVSDTDKGLAGAATPLVDRTGATSLAKVGEGTLILGNVAFAKVDGTGDTSSQFATWQLGRSASGNSGNNKYFDGAVRGVVGPGAGTSNSLQNATIQFCGGVYELDVSGGTATFNATVGTSAGNVYWRPGNESDYGGGGFAAYSSVPGNRAIVDLNSNGVRDTLLFARNSPGNEVFPGSGDSVGYFAANPFILGSRTANAALEFYDNIDFNTRLFPIRVIDNTNSMSDRAVLSGTLQNGGLIKDGDGVLELAGSNTYAGVTIVTNGTLLVNGWLNAGGGAVTVYSNATLGGTGVINRAVSVQDGGSIRAGDQGVGTLTVSNLALASSSRSVFTVGTGGGCVAVLGNLTLGGTIVVANLESRPTGTFTIITYPSGNTPSGSFSVGSLPPGMSATVDLSEPGKVKLHLAAAGMVFSVN